MQVSSPPSEPITLEWMKGRLSNIKDDLVSNQTQKSLVDKCIAESKVRFLAFGHQLGFMYRLFRTLNHNWTGVSYDSELWLELRNAKDRAVYQIQAIKMLYLIYKTFSKREILKLKLSISTHNFEKNSLASS